MVTNCQTDLRSLT